MIDARQMPAPWKRIAEKVAYCRSTFDFDFLPDVVTVLPSDSDKPMDQRRQGWAHPASEETGGPAIGIKLHPDNLRTSVDYLGRKGPWANNPKSAKNRRYKQRGYGELAEALILHELFHLVNDFDPEIYHQLEQRFTWDDHVWIPIAIRAYTPLYVPEVSTKQVAQIREVLG
jgi:hypothetical protein